MTQELDDSIKAGRTILVKDLEHVKVYETPFSRELYRSMCKPDINGIDLSQYRVYWYQSKHEDKGLYVMENPEGMPFHDEATLEGWYYYFDVLRMSLKCRTNLIDMAEEKLPKKEKKGRLPDTPFGRRRGRVKDDMQSS